MAVEGANIDLTSGLAETISTTVELGKTFMNGSSSIGSSTQHSISASLLSSSVHSSSEVPDYMSTDLYDEEDSTTGAHENKVTDFLRETAWANTWHVFHLG